MDTRTLRVHNPCIAAESYLADFSVPETASNYRLLVHRYPHDSIIVVALLNWGTSAEYIGWPTQPAMKHNIAKHLTGGNLVDAENVISVLRHVAHSLGD